MTKSRKTSKIVIITISCILAVLLLIAGGFCLSTRLMGKPVPSKALSRVNRPDLFSVASASFIPVNPDPTFDEISILEEDEFGRTLFFYSASDAMVDNFGFVCQKSDNGYAYFYDNACVCVAEHDRASENDFSALKSANDWGKPIDESKLSRVKLSDEYVRYDEVFSEKIKARDDADSIKTVYAVCRDKNGLALYCCKEKRGDGGYGMRAIIAKDDEVIAETELDTSDFINAVGAFKAENGWDSSDCEIILRRRAEND